MARGRKDYEKAVIAVESEGYRDLHGRILMNDNFEDTPFKWTTAGVGIHFESRQARAAYNGSYGAELAALSAVPPAVSIAQMRRYVPIDVNERLQFEMFWRASSIATMQTMHIAIHYYDGARLHDAFLQYLPINTIWRYMNDVGVVVDIPGSEQTFRDDAWNEVTLSIDIATDHYIRIKSNNMEINMGEIAFRNTGNLSGAHARVTVYISNITADPLLVSIDDVVLKGLER